MFSRFLECASFVHELAALEIMPKEAPEATQEEG